MIKIGISIYLMKRISAFILVVLAISCGTKVFQTKWTEETAPEKFVARFETSKGDFDMKIERRLSPKAADRFYQLLKHDYFKNILFYRVNPGFVAQFGTSDSIASKNWNSIKIPDEEVLQGNTKGTLSFARGGVETRGTQLFINLDDNSRLDTLDYNGVKGFPAFGSVTEGMTVLDSLNSGYGDTTMGDYEMMFENKKEFLKKYPKLDSIYTAYILK